jgi:hypothetical protein
MEKAAFYVALTRVRSLKQLVSVRDPFSLFELKKIIPSSDTRKEMGRLWEKFEQAMRLFNMDTVICKEGR